MFSLFKAKELKTPEPSFKNRVQCFWDWYAKVASSFYEMIEAGNCAALANEVSAKVDKFFSGMAWTFGVGKDGKGHSFTLSGEGVLHKQLLAQFWHSQAPTLSGWTFYPARQPGSIEKIMFKIGGRDFKPSEFWLTPEVNSEHQKVDIIVWHPLFGVLEKKDCLSALFLFLDEVLGEYGTGQWIGEIKLNDQKLAEAIPLGELDAYTKNLQAEKRWKKLPPGEAGVVYRCDEPHQRFLRGDVIAGTTMQPRLLQEYLSAHGELADPLAGTGADYVFITMDASGLPKGRPVEVRGALEGALDKRLKNDANGRLLGGALGTHHAYIDLLIFDGDESLRSVRSVLEEQNVASGTSINYFAKEKRGCRIIL